MTTTKDTISQKRLKQSASHATKTVKEREDSQKDIRLKQTGLESASTVSNHSDHEISDVECSVQCPVSKKLPGAYKGTRRHSQPKAVVIIECPACGWRTQPDELHTAEIEYVLHIENVHHGILPCAFCDPAATNRGQRILPTFETLAAHVREKHPERFSGDEPEPDGLPKGSFLNERSGGNMNVGQYVQGGQSERLPLLDAKMFKKLQDKSGRVTGKILAVRSINVEKFHGLGIDLKNGVAKFAFLAAFDRFDIGAIVRQLKSEETDDWIGQNIKFVTKAGSKGGTFVNVENPKPKK